MKLLTCVLLVCFVCLQYRLWVGEGSLAQRVELKQSIQQQLADNDILRSRNDALAVEIQALKNGLDVVEELAREQMGMIGENETFYLLLDDE